MTTALAIYRPFGSRIYTTDEQRRWMSHWDDLRRRPIVLYHEPGYGELPEHRTNSQLDIVMVWFGGRWQLCTIETAHRLFPTVERDYCKGGNFRDWLKRHKEWQREDWKDEDERSPQNSA